MKTTHELRKLKRTIKAVLFPLIEEGIDDDSRDQANAFLDEHYPDLQDALLEIAIALGGTAVRDYAALKEVDLAAMPADERKLWIGAAVAQAERYRGVEQ
jgi:hypothetical protein